MKKLCFCVKVMKVCVFYVKTINKTGKPCYAKQVVSLVGEGGTGKQGFLIVNSGKLTQKDSVLSLSLFGCEVIMSNRKPSSNSSLKWFDVDLENLISKAKSDYEMSSDDIVRCLVRSAQSLSKQNSSEDSYSHRSWEDLVSKLS